MRPLLLAAVLALSGCGMGGGGGSGSGWPYPGNAWVLVSVADLTAPHGYWSLRAYNATKDDGDDAVRIGFVDGEVVSITAHPDVGYHVVWSGTTNDASTSNTNTFTAHDGATVLVDFVP